MYNSAPQYLSACLHRYVPSRTLGSSSDTLLYTVVPRATLSASAGQRAFTHTPVQRPGIVVPHHSARQHHQTPSNVTLKHSSLPTIYLSNCPTVTYVSCPSYVYVHCFCVFFPPPLPLPSDPPPPLCLRLEPILTIGIRRTINRVIIIIIIYLMSGFLPSFP